MMTDPNIGTTLFNRYKLIELIGQGSMGRVYGAKDTRMGGVPVAIKFLAQALLNQRMKERFEREAMTCALLGQRSMHIVKVTDSGVSQEGVPFYVMEYLQGEGLGDVILRQPLPLPRFVRLSRHICLGLDCAHQGLVIDGEVCPIVHRDIKPSNILVSQDPSVGEVARILDFGIAKVLQADSGQTNCFMGTLAYSSPEQMEGRELDARSDIYSLGVMMFQMLTGKMPLHAETHNFGGWYQTHRFQPPRSLESANSLVKVPQAIESLVMSCLSKSPNDRPQTVAEVIRELEPFEHRYKGGRELGERISNVLKKPINPNPRSSSVLTSEEVCRFASWPTDMPIADIVFPKPLALSKETLATLWTMLPRQEIEKRWLCTRYNQFMFLPSPHPIILWLTVLYNRAHGPRWLPCYLDLKTPLGQQMMQLLGKSGQYRLLFFPKEERQRCAHVMTSTIAVKQCELLQEWAIMGQSMQLFQFPGGKTPAQISKEKLKEELERHKPKILLKLESMYDDDSDVSG
jgi:eukaryotic-like serine/threonine-protein kinase